MSSFTYRNHTSGLTQNKMAARRERFTREFVVKQVCAESAEIEDEGPEVSLEDVLETSISNFTVLQGSILNCYDFKEAARQPMHQLYHRHKNGVHGMDKSLMSSLP